MTLERRNTLDPKVNEKIRKIIVDPCHFKGRDFRYTRILDLYRHVKDIITYRV